VNKKLENMVQAYKDAREKYDFFDLNCWWDSANSRTFHKIDSFTKLRAEMESYGIKKAVVTNAECLKYDPFIGNESTAGLIKDAPNLLGCMVIAPEAAYDGTHLKEYIDKKVEQKFVAARMFPKKLNHSMRKWIVGEIFEYLEYKRLPLILWHNEVNWDFVEGLCQEYKNLPVIIEGNDVKLLYHNRNYMALLKKYPNFYMETHNLIIYSEMDYLVENISDEKLLFGTYFPYNTPDASFMPITAGRFGEESKFRIAGRNLEKLIDDIRR